MLSHYLYCNHSRIQYYSYALPATDISSYAAVRCWVLLHDMLPYVLLRTDTSQYVLPSTNTMLPSTTRCVVLTWGTTRLLPGSATCNVPRGPSPSWRLAPKRCARDPETL
eukprot:1929223-Rhodomonas_salina.1